MEQGGIDAKGEQSLCQRPSSPSEPLDEVLSYLHP